MPSSMGNLALIVLLGLMLNPNLVDSRLNSDTGKTNMAAAARHQHLDPDRPVPLELDSHIHTKPNMGVAFTKLSQVIMNGHSVMNLQFQIPIPRIPTPPQLEKPAFICEQDQTSTLVCLKLKYMALTLYQQIKRTSQEIIQRNNTIYSILSDPIDIANNDRNKRGLFNFVGSGFKSLFGTATSSDLHKIWNHVYALEQFQNGQQQYSSELKDKMVHYMNLTNDRVSALVSEQTQYHEAFQSLVEKLGTWKDTLSTMRSDVKALRNGFSAFSQIVMDLMVNYIQAFNQYKDFSDHLETFLSGVQDLHNGYVPFSLVSPSDLRHALHNLKTSLQTTDPTYSILHSNPGFYYNHKLTTYTYSPRNIFLAVQVPISSREAHFYIYSIKTFPVPLHTDQYNKSAGYTQIQNLPHFLAVSSSAHHHFDLSLTDYLTCTGNTFLTCPTTFPILHTNDHTCASALFRDRPNMANILCDIRIFADIDMPTNIQQTQSHSYMISYLQTTYQTVCEDQILHERPACIHCRYRLTNRVVAH